MPQTEAIRFLEFKYPQGDWISPDGCRDIGILEKGPKMPDPWVRKRKGRQKGKVDIMEKCIFKFYHLRKYQDLIPLDFSSAATPGEGHKR